MIENQPLPFSPANLSPPQIVQHRQSWQQVAEHYSSMAEWLAGPEDGYSEFATYQKLVQQLRASPIGDCFFASHHHSQLAISTVPETVRSSGSYVMISLLYPQQ